MMGSYFYWNSIRRTVAVFGTLFNDINVVRRDSTGKVMSSSRVPLAYGPKQKFLTRIDQASSYQDERIAIKLPRMSFEITSLVYDSVHKMQKMHFEKIKTDEIDKSASDYVIGPVFYNLGFDLVIMAKNQDDALQIMEQILPFFQPQYTVTVKEVKDTKKSDYPFTLTAVSMEDTYQGDFETRRAIVYTLSFESKVRFYGDVRTHALIKSTSTNYFIDQEEFAFLRDVQLVTPWTSQENDPYQIKRIRSWMNETIADITLDTAIGMEVGDLVVSQENASAAVVSTLVGNTITISDLDGDIVPGEVLYIPSKPQYTFTVQTITKRWS